jgi:uncharacterized membrane protein YedE/YeeE
MIEFLSQPWPWYVAGPLITLVMFGLLYSGGEFGVSDTLRTTCAAFGADKYADFFKFDWKKNIWNIMFVLGALIGGFIAATWLPNPDPVMLNPETISRLDTWGIAPQANGIAPAEIFSLSGLMTLRGFLMIIVGGFLVGFGTRYAGGCTSGHAISGLSNLQLPSLIAVVGFFIGGLIMTFLILPYIITL